jgi:protein tyrosine phosphatase
MIELINYNINYLVTCTKIYFPQWFDLSLISLNEIDVFHHEYYFVEYRDVNDNILLRHTCSAS